MSSISSPAAALRLRADLSYLSFRHSIEYAAYSGVKGAVLRRPHVAARRIGARLGRLAYRLRATGHGVALTNLERTMPELTRAQHQQITRRCFEHYGAYFLEIVSASRFDADQTMAAFDIDGWENVEAARYEKGGVFLTTGHFGCWEIGIYPMQLCLGNLCAVARPQNNPRVEADLRQMRERFGTVIIESHGAAHRMLNAFRKGGSVATVMDQHVRASAGILVPFLGQPARTSPILAYLSIHTGAPVVPFYCFPAEGGRYHMVFHPPIHPEGKGKEAEAALTQRYVESLEEQMRLRPELWLWMHRRWRA